MNDVKQTWLHEKPAYDFLASTDRLGVLRDFADKHLRGKSSERCFNLFPPELAAKQ